MASTRKKGLRKLPLFIIAVVAIAAAIVGADCGFKGKKSATQPYVAPSEPVPTDSISQSLAAFQGKVVILDFWATWCGPCRMEIPGFVSLQNKYRDQGLEIVGASLDPVTGPGKPEAVAPFMKQLGINYTVFMVKSGQAMQGYDAREGIPTTYVIDRQGKIVSRHVGYQPEAAFENEIKALL
jgi:thiol-disulfide isomerase/thioredoxin